VQEELVVGHIVAVYDRSGGVEVGRMETQPDISAETHIIVVRNKCISSSNTVKSNLPHYSVVTE
jgi:hypothetical protein